MDFSSTFMQVIMLSTAASTPHPPVYCIELVAVYLEVHFTALCLFFLGCVLHGSVPLPGSGRSSGPWSHSAGSFRWDCLLPETGLVQAWRSSGISLEWLENISTHCETSSQDLSVFARCGLMPAHRFSSPMPSDWVP